MVCSCLWRQLHHLFLLFASRYCLGLGVVAYAFDPSAWKAEADSGRYLCEFEDSRGYVERLLQKKKKTKRVTPTKILCKAQSS